MLPRDYFLVSLTDLTENSRDGSWDPQKIWSPRLAANRATSNWLVEVFQLPHIAFGVESLVQLPDANGSDLPLENWFDFDSSNPIGTDDGQSRFNLFGGTSSQGSDSRLTFDFRQHSSSEHDVGDSKDSKHYQWCVSGW